ncbi:unnamed protein product [Rhodiola kirilowii]
MDKDKLLFLRWTVGMRFQAVHQLFAIMKMVSTIKRKWCRHYADLHLRRQSLCQSYKYQSHKSL